VSTINTLSDRLTSYLSTEQISQVKRAYYYAEQAHDGQTRRSGEPYITHPLAVASILSSMHMDHLSLMAAMLHDVIEDTGIPKEAIAKQFGDTVAELVDGVSKLTQIKFESRAEAQAENFQKMALAMAKDIRVILVKLADRLHNMRTLGPLKPAKRRRIAKETLEIYAPIANRLGINKMRVEFEELGFAAQHPMRSERIYQAVKHVRGNRKEIVSKIKEALENGLERDQLPGRVIGREKHLYSIYEKMRAKRKSFSEIMDVYAFRIVVDKVDTCYRTLGAVHNLYKPVPGRFKDYIAIPKANGYQSLHTTLFGMHGVPIEIQIRTEEMEAMANNGIAAHWLYKSEDEVLSSDHSRARQWIKGLLEMQQHAGDSLEFIENVKVDLFPDEVYVFTPKGNILELPNGASAVDFAYAVHTDVGNSCVACRIDRRLAPLSQPLQSGQTVEVITAPGAHPNPSWLSYVVTAKARSNIRHFLKNQRRTESCDLGRRLLSKALSNLGSQLEDIPESQIEQLVAQTEHNNFDLVLEDIGLGNRMAYVIARRLIPETPEQALADEEQGLNKNLTKSQNTLAIKGTEGLVLSYAKCCKPIPGDPIIGYLSSGRGMVIHTESCHNIAEVRDNPEKCIQVSWDENIEGDFLVDLRVELANSRGVIAVIATNVTSAEANLEKISVEERDAKFSVLNLTLRVRDRIHLAHVLRRVRIIKEVIKIIRVKT